MKKVILGLTVLLVGSFLIGCGGGDRTEVETGEVGTPASPLSFPGIDKNTADENEEKIALQRELDNFSTVAELATFQRESPLLFINSFQDNNGVTIVVVGLRGDDEFDDNIVEIMQESETEHVVVELNSITNESISVVEMDWHEATVFLGIIIDVSANELETFVTSDAEIESTATEDTEGLVSFGSTFVFRDFEVEIGSADDIIWSTIENSRNDYYGNDVIGVPVTLTNLSGETGRLSLFSYKFFGPNGTQLSNVVGHREYHIWDQGDMRHEASQEGFFMLMYEGDGDYVIEFSDFSADTIEVVLPINK